VSDAPIPVGVIPGRPDSANPFVWQLVSDLTIAGHTLAVAESLTGGLLAAEFVRPPGASAVFLGGVVAYETSLKHTLLGVEKELLDTHGPVHPEVARQMAANVRERLAVDGKPADIGMSTTGVAGPDPQQGQEAGLVYVGIAIGDTVEAIELHLEGTRDQIRAHVVSEAIAALAKRLEAAGE
jgi:nicotinamide-nucleotide amidase